MSEADAEASAEAFSILVWRQTSVKTSDFFLCDFTRATTPATHSGIFFPPFPHTHSPLLSSILPPLSCVSKPFRLSLDHALTSHADGNVILLTCAPSLHLLLHLFLSLWLSGIVSQLSTKQTSFPIFLYNPLSASWAWLRPGFVQKTQQLQLPSLTISLFLTPHVRLAGVGALVCSFQIIGNTQPTRPYAITTHLNPMRLL